jgi:hypothetical protein
MELRADWIRETLPAIQFRIWQLRAFDQNNLLIKKCSPKISALLKSSEAIKRVTIWLKHQLFRDVLGLPHQGQTVVLTMDTASFRVLEDFDAYETTIS